MNKKYNYKELTLSTAQIEVPRESYQRGFSQSCAEKIAAEFDERIANEPKVGYRDGKFYVFDGQHTIAARKILNGGNDVFVKCKVYYGMAEQEEALLFAQQTGVSAPLSAGARLRANIFGGTPLPSHFWKPITILALKSTTTRSVG